MKKKKSGRSATFPKLTKQGQTGNVGVEAVASIVNNQLRWLFRKVHQEEDFGIDGHMDVVLDEGSVTGQSIAMQIKTGHTFLNTKTKSGFVFYGERKHLNYYLNNRLPVLIVLCEPESRTCYYEVFDPDKTEKTPRGWKMIIPFTQTLDASSKPFLLELVGPAIDHLSKLEEHWAVTKLMSSAGHILFTVDRDDIDARDTSDIDSFISRITSNLPLCEKLQGKIDISVSGYDSDPRELWDIPEVRDWFKLVEPVVKYWFYFLTTHGKAGGLKVLAACLCNAKAGERIDAAGRREIILDNNLLGKLMERNFIYLNDMTDRLGNLCTSSASAA